jgi:putative toxin-antitoxin system antitoxin component (TIGR02293 family)
MKNLVEAARFLQIPGKDKALTSPLQFIEFLEKGLPLSSIERIAEALAPRDAGFRYHIVPRATLARMRVEKRRLNKAQGELVARLAEVWTGALRVWKSEEDARSFLTRKHPLLENNRPIDLALQSEIGAQLVRDILGRLEYGTAV